jgi:hypothetical protein
MQELTAAAVVVELTVEPLFPLSSSHQRENRQEAESEEQLPEAAQQVLEPVHHQNQEDSALLQLALVRQTTLVAESRVWKEAHPLHPLQCQEL